jgi:hypothetical protein
MKLYSVILTLATLLCFGSCSYVFVKAYGISHHVDNLSQTQIEEAFEIIGIADSESYWMDTTFVDYLLAIDTTNFALFQKNNYQPLQFKAFNNEGKLVSHLANCYAGGFPNLNWDWMFTEFPPAVNDQLFHSLLTFSEAKKFFKPLTNAERVIPEKPYSVVVIWTDAFGRQNKRFIEKVKEFRSTHQDKSNYYFVNFDNIIHQMSK